MFGTRVPWNRGNGTWRLRAPLAGTCTPTLSHLSLINLSLYEINERTVHLQKKHLEIPRIGRILPFSLTLLNVLSVEYRRNRAQHTCNPASVNKKALADLGTLVMCRVGRPSSSPTRRPQFFLPPRFEKVNGNFIDPEVYDRQHKWK